MFGHNNPQRDQNRKVFTDSLNGLATVVAVMVSIIGAPYVNQLTQPYVWGIAERNYPSDIVALISLAWEIACFPFVFFAARASVGIALMVAGSWAAYRFL